jgi:hypothetical protein
MKLFQALKCLVATPLLTITTGYVDNPSSIVSSMGCSPEQIFQETPWDGGLPGQTPLDGHHGENDHGHFNWSSVIPFWGPVIPLLSSGASSSLLVNISAGTPPQYVCKSAL